MTRSSLDVPWQDIDWAPHIHDVALRGRNIRYVDIGSGPAVVLIHGQGGSWQFWLRSLPLLAAKCRVIAIDLAGFGGSERIGSGDVFTEHVGTINDLLIDLGLAKAVIVGHSMGGLVSIRFTCEHPDRVAGLALVDAGGSPLGPIRLALILATFRVFNIVFGIQRVSQFVARSGWLSQLFFALAVGDRHTMSTDLALEILPRMTSPGFIETMEAAAIAVGEVAPDQINCPSLVIWGTKDRILTVTAGRALAEEIPDARFAALDGIGHCPMIELPVEFSNLITDFVLDPRGGRPPVEPVGLHVVDAERARRRWWRKRLRHLRDVS